MTGANVRQLSRDVAAASTRKDVLRSFWRFHNVAGTEDNLVHLFLQKLCFAIKTRDSPLLQGMLDVGFLKIVQEQFTWSPHRACERKCSFA